MSAITATDNQSVRAVDRADHRPGAGRLVAVELRKMVDTRAGFWLPLGIGALTIVTAIVLMITEPTHAHTFHHTLYVTLQPLALLLPVMGVLLITSEWSQRTALTTFALVPNRARVMGAKLVACLAVSVAALVVALAVSALAEAVSPGSGRDAWTLAPAMIPQAFLYLATAMITGAAFGAAVLISAPAIVVYLLLPTIWNAAVGSIHSLRHVATWLDSSQSLAPLARNPLSATDWLHALVTLTLWMGLPLAIGCWRLTRQDVG